jgi:GxxExxY protein
MNEKASFEPDAELDRLAAAVIGAAIEVHRVLGPGFLESIYGEAMLVELGLRGLSAQQQVPISIRYKGVEIGQNRLDLRVEGRLIVEIKAVDALSAVHQAQVISYLKATGHTLALLINFNVPILKNGIKRVILSPTWRV